MADATARLKVIIDAQNNASGGLSGLQKQLGSTFGNEKGGLTNLAGVAKAALAGVAVAGVAGIARALSGATSTAAEFTKEMNKVRAITGASERQFKALRSTAMAMGRSTQFSAMQASGALQFLGMAGLSVKESIDALPGTLNLAAAGGMALADAADIATNIMTGMGMEVDELGPVIDGLAQASRKANTNVEQIGQAMTFVAGMANNAGVTFTETTAALGALANAGLRASRGGTSLAAAFTSMLKPSKEASDIMEEANLNFTEADGTLRPLVDIVRQLEDASLTARDTIVLFGDQGGRAMSALGMMGSENLQKLQEQIENADGVADEMRVTMTEGLGGATTALNSAWEGLNITIGSLFEGSAEIAVDSLTKVVRAIDDLITGTENLNVQWVDADGNVVSLGKIVKKEMDAVEGHFKTATAASTEFGGNLLAQANGDIKTALNSISSTAEETETKLDKSFFLMESPVAEFAQNIRGEDGSLTKVIEKIEELPTALEQVGIHELPGAIKPIKGAFRGIETDFKDIVVEKVPQHFKTLGTKIEEIDPPKMPPGYRAGLEEELLPEPTEFQKKAQSHLDVAFGQALGTLIRTGSWKASARAFGGALLNSIVADLTTGLASRLSRSITQGLGGIQLPTMRFSSPSRAVGGGIRAMGSGKALGGISAGTGTAGAASLSGASASGMGLGASAGLAAGGFAATIGAVHLLNQLSLGGQSPARNTVDSVVFSPGALFPKVEANLLQEGYNYGQTIQAALAADIGGANWNEGRPSGLVTNAGAARGAWLASAEGAGLARSLNNVTPAGSMRSESAVMGMMGDRFAGFRFGGRFVIPGEGGPDSQIIPIMGTPGEQVSITPPGAGWQGSGSSGQVVENHFSIQINALDSQDVETFVRDKLFRIITDVQKEESLAGIDTTFSDGVVTPELV